MMQIAKVLEVSILVLSPVGGREGKETEGDKEEESLLPCYWRLKMVEFGDGESKGGKKILITEPLLLLLK